MAPRSRSSGISRTSTPSRKTVPGGGSCRRGSRWISVDLPEPVAPTSATVCPAAMRERHVVEDPPLGSRIGEDQVADLDGAGQRHGAAGVGHVPVADVRDGVEHLQHPLPRRHAPLQDVGDPSERDHRPAEHHEVGVERDELAERDLPANDVAAAEPEHQQRAEAEEERHARKEQPLQPDQHAVAPHVFAVGGAEPLDLVGLLVVGADHAHAGERLLDDRAQMRQLFLDRFEPLVDGAAEVTGR